MAAVISTGSPKMSRKKTPIANIVTEDNKRVPSSYATNQSTVKTGVSMTINATDTTTAAPEAAPVDTQSANDMSGILARLKVNDTRIPNNKESNHTDTHDTAALDTIINNFSDQHRALKRQEMDLKAHSSYESGGSSTLSFGSDLCDNSFVNQSRVVPEADKKEMQRMRQELETAKSIISRQERELHDSRNLQHTMEQAVGPPSEADFPLQDGHHHPDQFHTAFNAAAQPFTSRTDGIWMANDDNRLDGNVLPHPRLTRNRPSFASPPQAAYNDISVAGLPSLGYPSARFPLSGHAGPFTNTLPVADITLPTHRPVTETTGHAYGVDERTIRGLSAATQIPAISRPGAQFRSSSTFSDPLSPVMHAGINLAGLGGPSQYGFQDRPFNGPISPLSPDFPPMAGQQIMPTTGMNAQTYITPLEPMNYRRLLDKSVSCDWKYIVDKIVCNNDQQASIFLQQKLKVGTAEQKYEIVESIVNQAYPLMINRFGNFLVQRCFEHGTPDQVIAIANAIHGNVISLSMDPFGCHVVQKAFDAVPEDHKADMVRELLRRIHDTVIHRYACHVWQKLFELRWTGEPPQIMLKVNEDLRTKWHQVALGETGSLVVQNIFENCVEEEKRPAIEEVIDAIDLIAHGQFGNWCIQHLCEHGSPPDKRRVINHILTNAYSYSIDQFASKVVEKCLKIGGPEFLDQYLNVITEARPDRPRIPLIDIAGDQYGNYLIQWILMNTHHQQREQVAIHIRKHMVSLRGSKFGSRVAMLCSNPAAATRPGPPSTLINPYGAPGQPARNGAWPRYR